MTASSASTCWAVGDGAAGNERQVEALARALGVAARILRIRVRQPWDALAPRLLPGAHAAIRDADGATLAPPWPDIAIGCGRRAALLTRALRGWSEGRCFTVQILDPRIDPAAFDVVVAPQHDGLAGANVIHTIGALNPVDAGWLAKGRCAFAAIRRCTGAADGGADRRHEPRAAPRRRVFRRIARALAGHANDGGSFLVSVSRRTPPTDRATARRVRCIGPACSGPAPRTAKIPTPACSRWADRIVVTPDSVNMISEACATGKPVYTFAPRAIAGKLASFHRTLHASGHLRTLGESVSKPQPPPLAETREIAELVRARWLAHRAAR